MVLSLFVPPLDTKDNLLFFYLLFFCIWVICPSSLNWTKSAISQKVCSWDPFRWYRRNSSTFLKAANSVANIFQFSLHKEIHIISNSRILFNFSVPFPQTKVKIGFAVHTAHTYIPHLRRYFKCHKFGLPLKYCKSFQSIGLRCVALSIHLARICLAARIARLQEISSSFNRSLSLF